MESRVVARLPDNPSFTSVLIVFPLCAPRWPDGTRIHRPAYLQQLLWHRFADHGSRTPALPCGCRGIQVGRVEVRDGATA